MPTLRQISTLPDIYIQQNSSKDNLDQLSLNWKSNIPSPIETELFSILFYF